MKSSEMHIQGPQVNQFNNVSPRKIPRSSFKRDFTRRTTFNSNYLIPIFCDEILPGDDVSLNVTSQVRMTTPIKPIMDNLYLETFWFFVPNRLVWDNWEKFQGQQTNPGDSVAFTIPVLDSTKAPLSTTGFLNQSIYDYMGLPTLVTSAGAGDGLSVLNALYNRGMDLIWNEWFRDENLQNSLTIQTGNGPDDPGTYALRKRNSRKDYFTSCLPWAQKGNPVQMPLGTSANIKGIGFNDLTGGQTGPVTIYETGGTSRPYAYYHLPLGVGGAGTHNLVAEVVGSGPNTDYPNIYADLSTAVGPTINAIRQAALYQQILELDARAGTRYVESIYSRFGVVSPDFRLQRPELCGTGHSMVNIYSVPQTQGTGASGTTTPQGNLAAFSATSITGGHGCRYSATEHGMLIGLANVRADLTYQQGIPRKFTRQTRLDFYEPLLNGLGEQTVLLNELYCDGTTNDMTAFGYQERFSEYRFFNSEITGVFRANDPLTLKVWNLSKQLVTPALNSAFITEAVPMDQVLAVNTATSPNFLADIAYSYNHVRPMPIRSNPGIDRL